MRPPKVQAIVSSSDLVVGVGEKAAASAAEAATAAAGGASLTDNVTTALFFAAVAALSAITLGVRLPGLQHTDRAALRPVR